MAEMSDEEWQTIQEHTGRFEYGPPKQEPREFLPGPWSPDLPDWKIQSGGASYINLDMIPQADRERERQQMMMQLRRRMMQNQNWTSMMPQARPTDEQALEYQKKIWPSLREPGWAASRGYGQPSHWPRGGQRYLNPPALKWEEDYGILKPYEGEGPAPGSPPVAMKGRR